MRLRFGAGGYDKATLFIGRWALILCLTSQPGTYKFGVSRYWLAFGFGALVWVRM